MNVSLGHEAGIGRAPQPRDALQLPEILRFVMEELHSRPEHLYAAALVSRSWAHDALDILWRSPPERAILSVAAGERREFYAAKICELTDACGVEVYRDLPLPRLHRLTLEGDRPGREPSPAQRYYIRPQLQELRGFVTHHVLEALIEQSPPLRVIAIYAYDKPPQALAPCLADYIGSCERLESLTLMCMVADNEAMLTRLFPVLARRRHLAKLHLIGDYLPPLLIQEALHEVQQQQLLHGDAAAEPFASVKTLRVKTTVPAGLALARMMLSITRLDLDVVHAPADMLPSVALLPTHQPLRKLLLHGWRMQLSWPALMALRSLSQLRVFWLSARTLSWLSSDGTEAITGKHLRSLLTPLTHLDSLGLKAALPIAADSLGAIGEACPTLRHLSLSGSFSLRALACARSPCMPNLEHLAVTTFSPIEPNYRIKSVQVSELDHQLKLLREHAPKLRVVTAHESLLDDLIVTSFPSREDEGEQ